MLSDCDQKKVSLSEINDEDDTFRITTNTETDDLVSVFDRIGLINPPILKPKPCNTGFQVVCGYRRVAAARVLSWETIRARILPTNADTSISARLAISENTAERSLNLIETSRALHLLSTTTREKKEFYESAGMLGLPRNSSLVKKLIPLCNLPATLQQGIIDGRLALPSALMLSQHSDETAVFFAEFLNKLKLSLRKQREVIELIKEIAIREDMHIQSVLQSPDIVRIVEDPELETPRKAGLIREYLKKWRFPHLSTAQASFEALKGDLKLAGNPSLRPPAGFEGNRYTISFSFENLSELENHRKTIENIQKNERFLQLLASREPHANLS